MQFLNELKEANLLIKTDFSLKNLTHFKIGGNAEFFAQPSSVADLKNILKIANKYNIAITIFGDGSNLLISDKGIKGIVIATTGLKEELFTTISSDVYRFSSGVLSSDLAMASAKKALLGFEGFYGLPGTIGGACYMNARCYSAEISEVFVSAKVLTFAGDELIINKNPSEWDYKKSPFQHKDYIIISVDLKLTQTDDANKLIEKAQSYYDDRESKGHFKYPSAGSTFKNDRSLGSPTGAILESLNLKGYHIGDAYVSDYHANIFVNKGNASSDDMLALINHAKNLAKEKLNVNIEAEVVYLGE